MRRKKALANVPAPPPLKFLIQSSEAEGPPPPPPPKPFLLLPFLQSLPIYQTKRFSPKEKKKKKKCLFCASLYFVVRRGGENEQPCNCPRKRRRKNFLCYIHTISLNFLGIIFCSLGITGLPPLPICHNKSAPRSLPHTHLSRHTERPFKSPREGASDRGYKKTLPTAHWTWGGRRRVCSSSSGSSG